MSWENFDHDIEMIETWWHEGFTSTAIAGLVRCVAHLGNVARDKGTPSQPPAPETGLPTLDAQHQPLNNGVVQPFELFERFDEGLVERLARTAWEFRMQSVAGPPPWEALGNKATVHIQLIMRGQIRTILTEPAKTSVNLLTVEDLKAVTEAGGYIAACELVAARVVPTLVAQHARIAELEAHTPANSCSNSERAQYELTIEQLSGAVNRERAKVAELEKLRDDAAAYDSDLTEENCKLQERVAELEKRLAELTAPIDADEQTPGELLITLQHGNIRGISKGILESAEHEANAVLRAFGPRMVREALGRVRERIGQLSGRGNRIPYDYEHGPFADYVCEEETFTIIDAEIAKLEAPKPVEQVDVAVREALDRMTAPWTPMVRVPTGQEFVGVVDNGLRVLGFELKRPTSIHWGMVDSTVEGLFEQWQTEQNNGAKRGD